MSFQPILPQPGLAGWAFLQRTKQMQQANFVKSPSIERDVEHFRSAFHEITSAAALVDNPRALKVALGAFGLQDQFNSRALIRKIVEDGVSERGALANRLADKRFLDFARAFEYLSAPDNMSPQSNFPEDIIVSYQRKLFEAAVGEQDRSIQLALTLQHELPKLSVDYSSNTARWFAVIGNPYLRESFQISLGFPQEFSFLDVESQVLRMKSAAQRKYGTSDFIELSRDEHLEQITRDFLVMSQLRGLAVQSTSSSIALTLLRGL